MAYAILIYLLSELLLKLTILYIEDLLYLIELHNIDVQIFNNNELICAIEENNDIIREKLEIANISAFIIITI
jgi:hypothetical protein